VWHAPSDGVSERDASGPGELERGGRDWVDRWIPEAMQRADPKVRWRARMSVLFPVPVAFAALLAAIVQLNLEQPMAALLYAAGALVALATMRLLKVTGSLALTGHVQIALTVALMSVAAVVAGGLGTPRFLAMVVVPLAASLLVGWVGAFAWTLVLVGETAVLLALHLDGSGPRPGESLGELQTVHGYAAPVILLLGWAISAFYDHLSTRMARELEVERDRADRANESKSDFVAHVSHELRTPLTGVRGSADLRRQAIQRRPDAGGIAEHVETIAHSSEILLSLVNDLLDLSRIEAGALVLEKAPMELRSVLERILRVEAPLAQKKGVLLVLHVEPDVPEQVEGDALRIGQVVTNLVHNALKFTHRGTVRVHVRRLGEVLRFEIQDTGVGMPREVVARLFQRFAQASEGTAREYGGSGLGLAISQRLVSLMGGRIEVESEVGAGSTFSFEARLAALASPAPDPDVEGLAVAISLVDPEERAAVEASLRWLGAEVVREGADVGIGAPTGSERMRWLRVDVPGGLMRPVAPHALRHALLELLGVRRGSNPILMESMASGSVLVVDDDATNRAVLGRQLESLGYGPLLAATPERGRELAEEAGEELVAALLDLRMGSGDDGFDLGASFAEAYPELPLLLLTAQAGAKERERAQAIGFRDVLLKPLRLDEVRRALLGYGRAEEAVGDVDEDTWSELEGVGDFAFLEDLVLGFLDTSAKRVELLAAIDDDHEAYRIAHALKGSAAQMGAVALAACAERIELSPQTREEHLVSLADAAARTRAELESRLRAVAPRETGTS